MDENFTATELKKMKRKVTAFLCDYHDCEPQDLSDQLKKFIKEIKYSSRSASS